MASQVRRYFAMVLLEIREWSENSRMLHFAALPLALPFSPWSTHRAIRRATYGFDRLYTVPAVWASLCQSDNELKPLPRITPPIERAVINHLVQINPHLFLIETGGFGDLPGRPLEYVVIRVILDVLPENLLPLVSGSSGNGFTASAPGPLTRVRSLPNTLLDVRNLVSLAQWHPRTVELIRVPLQVVAEALLYLDRLTVVVHSPDVRAFAQARQLQGPKLKPVDPANPFPLMVLRGLCPDCYVCIHLSSFIVSVDLSVIPTQGTTSSQSTDRSAPLVSGPSSPT